ncbi:hypothetical protein HHL16_01735 [Pseudoflavitalea sp. G-6-1-2]|uniref:cupredoxin domain-containing protein n=1 Tax=Pseudoflavitalea sp. G-6-1-2 TaxID=2728841 RepID=UPI001469F083|nr:plastocyanin/azurin family copper-binding protein [Pseudoflavitalea sp. G-6-1-2]NML19570.1 hypothetical protein [Pseudoflavitalea sp. G-6-1-2]
MTRIIILSLLTVFFISAIIPEQHKPVTKIVKMRGMRFDPSSIQVSIGDTVIWINESNGEHNVVANDGTFKSTMLENGQLYALVFEKKGVYKYYCQPHRIMGMKGVVEVKD